MPEGNILPPEGRHRSQSTRRPVAVINQGDGRRSRASHTPGYYTEHPSAEIVEPGSAPPSDDLRAAGAWIGRCRKR